MGSYRLEVKRSAAKEIADLLGLSEQTVKNTKVAIYQKLGVRNAVELTLKLKEPA